MKVDHKAQVDQLFSPIEVDAAQKKLVFKMIRNTKDNQSKTNTTDLWKAIMQASDRETCRKGTNEQLVADKGELIRILEALENDNLIMYAAEDNQVVLI